MGIPLDKVTVRRAEKDVKTVKESYVKRLRDNSSYFAHLMCDLIVSVDKDGKFVFVNDAAVEFWGKSSKSLLDVVSRIEMQWGTLKRIGTAEKTLRIVYFSSHYCNQTVLCQ